MKQIVSLKNPLIQDLLLLHDQKHRNKKQLFLIEGDHLITVAFSQKQLVTILIDEKYFNKFDKLLKDSCGVDIIIVNAKIIKKLSQNKSPQPLIGLCTMKKFNTYLTNNNIVMIDTIQDPGNLGNILRSAIAFNISEIYLSQDSVDLYNHKVISASQGAIFYTNVYYEEFEQLLVKLKANQYKIYGTFLHESNAIKLNKITFSDKNVLLFGNEGRGIDSKYRKYIDANMIIATTVNVESLNLATSIAIVIYCLFVSNILK